ncbi:protein FAN-like [Oscarella lobularis]|uniref:protein FAN-like n=1 Tax=Oscarella lobularis TaxID=121494 RepID=UPI0033131F84
MNSVAEVKQERFSLLLLEPGEIYFEDYSAIYYPAGLADVKKKQKGRLKLCSKSLIFDPHESACPILKLNFRDVRSIQKTTEKLLLRVDAKGGVMSVSALQVIEMKENNVIGPYVFKKVDRDYFFSLTYVNLQDVLPHVQQVHKATTLNVVDQMAMISSIVRARQAMVSFNASWLESLYEKISVEMTGERVTPLVANPGRIVVTTANLYFQPFNKQPDVILKISLASIERVVKRRYLLRQVGIEIFYAEGKSLLLVFALPSDREYFYNQLLLLPDVHLQDTGQENMTLRWQNGTITNYDYLMYLNSMADRSVNDLTQYPVFPWIIADYTSPELDLEKESTFRDLSKPIGALTEERLARYQKRYAEMTEPKFLYGSHYSTPGYVLFYLVRTVPEHVLCLHSGKFDHADRMFNSISDTWENCLGGNADVKELIPEFFCSPGDFLLNKLDLDLGIRQDRTKVHNVQLPPWAKDPEDMTKKFREALECPFVSARIHHWIDLIFGYKQRGREAIKANNLFYHLTYEGAVDLDRIKDPAEKAALEAQILEFGQTPKQLFTQPHPQRKTTNESLAAMETSAELPEKDLENIKSWCQLKNLKKSCSLKVHREALTDVGFSKDSQWIFSVSQDSCLKMSSAKDLQLNRSVSFSGLALSSCVVMPDSKTLLIGSWDNNIYIYSVEYGRVLDSLVGHDDAVTSVCWKNGLMLTSSWDSSVKVWDYTPESGGKKGPPPSQRAELEHETGVNCLDFDPGSMQAVAGMADGSLILWSINDQMIIGQHSIHSDGGIKAVRFSPDGQTVLSVGADQYMKVLDVKTGTEVYSKQFKEGLRCLAWNNEVVLAGGESGNLHVWDMVNVESLASLRGHQGPITCLAVSPDGNYVVTGSEDKSLTLWAVE